MGLAEDLFEKYGAGADEASAGARCAALCGSVPEDLYASDTLKTVFSLLDLTTLNTEDNRHTAIRFTDRLNAFGDEFPGVPPVAAICVYPLLVEDVRNSLTAPGVRVAAVGAGFPSSQTFAAVKVAECGMLVQKGADEIDVVISVGRFLAGDYLALLNELILIRDATAGAHLKVILETGLLKTAANIRLASLIAMEAGADFIKTSTGKEAVNATLPVSMVMVRAIRQYFEATGVKVGYKPAGGISKAKDSLNYLILMKEELGNDWLQPSLFRFGASSLLADIERQLEHYTTGKYSAFHRHPMG